MEESTIIDIDYDTTDVERMPMQWYIQVDPCEELFVSPCYDDEPPPLVDNDGSVDNICNQHSHIARPLNYPEVQSDSMGRCATTSSLSYEYVLNHIIRSEYPQSSETRILASRCLSQIWISRYIFTCATYAVGEFNGGLSLDIDFHYSTMFEQFPSSIYISFTPARHSMDDAPCVEYLRGTPLQYLIWAASDYCDNDLDDHYQHQQVRYSITHHSCSCPEISCDRSYNERLLHDMRVQNILNDSNGTNTGYIFPPPPEIETQRTLRGLRSIWIINNEIRNYTRYRMPDDDGLPPIIDNHDISDILERLFVQPNVSSMIVRNYTIDPVALRALEANRWFSSEQDLANFVHEIWLERVARGSSGAFTTSGYCSQ